MTAEIEALVALLGMVEEDPDMIYRDEQCYNIAAKAATALTALQADLAAAVARAEKAERALSDGALTEYGRKVVAHMAALPDAKGE